MPNPHQIAVRALAKCQAYDPWFPNVTEGMVEAWAEQLAKHEVAVDDALAGVTKMYEDNGSGFRPLPRDLIRAARAVRTAKPETPEELDARNLANDQRLGLETDWAKPKPELASDDERRLAIEQFATRFGELMEEAQAQPPQEPVKVAERKPQPLESMPEPDGDDCPHCHYPGGCLVTHACLGMDYRHK